MRRWVLCAAVTLAIGLECNSQEYDSYTAISEFTGHISLEDIDPEEVERLEKLLLRPLQINMMTAARLRECGLLTQYQTASLVTYRSLHGDVHSLTELAAIDGFGQEFVKKLAPFISLRSRLPSAGRSIDRRHISQEIEVKGGLRAGEKVSRQYAARYMIDAGGSLSGSISVSKSADSDKPDAISGNLFWHSQRHSAKLGAGSFNARFGQGLALWNGMSISGQNRPSSYLKKTSYISPSNSFSGNYSFKGLAAEVTAGCFKLSALAALTEKRNNLGFLPAGNISWLWPFGQIGLTQYVEFANHMIPDMKTSCDIALTIQGVDIFAEAVYDWCGRAAASLAGIVFPVEENLKFGTLLRYYPADFNSTYSAAIRSLTNCSNEYGASLSSEFSGGSWIRINGHDGFASNHRRFSGSASLDAAHFPLAKNSRNPGALQIKSLADMRIMLSGSLELNFRLSERYRTWGNKFRTDARLDISYYSRLFDLSFRANAVKCNDVSFLFYAEGTFHRASLKLHFRTGVFHVDRWDDRIYAYERDIPGSFNVPAYYGRGYWISFTGNWKFARWGRAYLRGSMTQYPFMQTKKPGKAELKLMLKFQI